MHIQKLVLSLCYIKCTLKQEGVFSKRNIEDFDNSAREVTGFTTVKTQYSKLMQIIGTENLTSDNCNIDDLEHVDKKLCKHFKDNIIENTRFFKKYLYIIVSFVILFISICQNVIDVTNLTPSQLLWNNIIFAVSACVLISMIARSIWLIYTFKKTADLLFKPTGILNQLIKGYNKTYDQFKKEQDKAITKSESTAKESDYN